MNNPFHGLQVAQQANNILHGVNMAQFQAEPPPVPKQPEIQREVCTLEDNLSALHEAVEKLHTVLNEAGVMAKQETGASGVESHACVTPMGGRLKGIGDRITKLRQQVVDITYQLEV